MFVDADHRTHTWNQGGNSNKTEPELNRKIQFPVGFAPQIAALLHHLQREEPVGNASVTPKIDQEPFNQPPLFVYNVGASCQRDRPENRDLRDRAVLIRESNSFPKEKTCFFIQRRPPARAREVSDDGLQTISAGALFGTDFCHAVDRLHGKTEIHDWNIPNPPELKGEEIDEGFPCHGGQGITETAGAKKEIARKERSVYFGTGASGLINSTPWTPSVLFNSRTRSVGDMFERSRTL